MLNRIAITIGLCGLTVVMGVGLSFAHDQFMPRPERISTVTPEYTAAVSSHSTTAQPVAAQPVTGQPAAATPATIDARPVVSTQPEPLAAQASRTTADTPEAKAAYDAGLSFGNAAVLNDPARTPTRPATTMVKHYDLATLGASPTAPVLFDNSFSTSQSRTKGTQQVTPVTHTAAQTYPKSLKTRTMIGVYR